METGNDRIYVNGTNDPKEVERRLNAGPQLTLVLNADIDAMAFYNIIDRTYVYQTLIDGEERSVILPNGYKIETEGISNLGEGVIYTNVYWLKMLPILAENHIAKEIHQCYENIKMREILPIFDEIHQPDRLALDAIIFDALNLTQGEPDGVYEAVVKLVESRLRKARSLKGK